MPHADELPDGPPGEFWRDFFKANEPTAAAVRTRVRSLNDAGRHDHVVAIIEAALINGQTQPWMYEILALSMELTGRPREEVERVVLSLADFGQANYDSMLQSARYLISFERKAAALTLLHQATLFDADRSEAYLMALPIVESTRDAEAAQWALPGAIANLWGEGTDKAREKTLTIAKRIARKLKADGNAKAADKLLADVSAASIPDVRVSLEWDGEADLDLVIREPRGTSCTHQSPVTTTGGRLLEDGFGPAKPREQYVCPLGYSGDFLIEIHRAVGVPVGKRGRLVIEVRQPDGTVETTKRSVDVTVPGEPIRVKLEEGRRESPQQILDARPPARPRVRIAEEAAPQRAGAVGIVPQVSLISEGAALSTAPVVSPDRRYVRLGVRPWFQNITDVQTFSFVGPANNQNGQ